MHSNPLNKFIETNCVEDAEGYIVFSDFFEEFKEYLKNDRGRLQGKKELGAGLRARKYVLKAKKIYDKFDNQATPTTIFGLKWKDESNLTGQSPINT